MLRYGKNAIAAYLADRLVHEQFLLIDVGCSGGIDSAWRSFDDRLSAIGIDPNRTEIVRLTEAESNANVRYYAAFAGVADDHPIHQLHEKQSVLLNAGYSGVRRSPWGNLGVSAMQDRRTGRLPQIPAPEIDLRTHELSEASLANKVDMEIYRPQTGRLNFAAWEGARIAQSRLDPAEQARQAKLAEENLWHDADLVGPECRIDVSELLDQLRLESVDFIKIDIDGSDYEVLFSLEDKLRDLNVLGAALEVNFIGSGLPHHHVFHNTDRLMRSAGFGLFGLTVRTYSSSALPSPFMLGFPAQSVTGRPFQGDALYLRDFAFQLDGADSDRYSWEKIAKLIALFAMFNLPDQAAETALRFRDRLKDWFNVDTVLDMLAAQMQEGRGTVSSYPEYMAEFASEDPWFFDAQHRAKP
jgi:hypothetical protein